MQFKIRNDFILRYRGQNYTTDNLSQAVSYWLHRINAIEERTMIGVAYAGLSFSAVALILALYKSGRNYCHLGVHSRRLTHDTQNNLKLSHVFVVGNTDDIEHFVNIPQSYTRTDSWHHAWHCGQWAGRENLVIPFSLAQTVYAYTSGTTGDPKLTSMTADVEAYSIQRAQELFFVADDYCVFLHGMSHQGVHTTAILPGIFTARVVSLAETDTWNEEILSASHIQYFYTMKDLYPLPEQVRVITTGGDMLKPVFLEHIKRNCSYQHLFDIYGLTECLPPLAVRDVQTVEDIEKEFHWVNTAYSYDVDKLDNILIIRPDGQQFLTTDRACKTDSGLMFHGRNYPAIRIHGNLSTVWSFKQLLEKQTGVVNYAVEIKNNDFVLHALKSDFAVIDKFIQTNYIDIQVSYADSVNTNGGIKTVS
jgi:hypothetical protein